MEEALFPRPAAVIFDLDGVLLDTEPIYLEATRELLARYGRELDPTVWWDQVGRPSPVVAQNIAAAHGLPVTGEAFHRERQAMVRTALMRSRPLPGAIELTRALKAAGVALGVATSSSRETFGWKTEEHGEWFGLFDCIVTRDEVAAGKPAPDSYLRAAALLAAEPSRCLVFEDAPAGIEAARRAGTRSIGVGTLHGTLEADLVVGSLADLPADAFDRLLGGPSAR